MRRRDRPELHRRAEGMAGGPHDPRQGLRYDGELSEFGKTFCYATRGTGGMTHSDPGDRPMERIRWRVTLHIGDGRDAYLLLPIISRDPIMMLTCGIVESGPIGPDNLSAGREPRDMAASVIKVTESPLRALNRADEVARLLGERIRAGEFSVGARLPSEQIMASQFGVSRPVIREAIARLKNEGLVRTRQGSGAFVCEWKMDSLQFDPGIGGRLESVLLIYELRKGIEAEAAALASARRTRAELANIEEAGKTGQRYYADPGREHQGGHGLSPRHRRGIA